MTCFLACSPVLCTNIYTCTRGWFSLGQGLRAELMRYKVTRMFTTAPEVITRFIGSNAQGRLNILVGVLHK